VLQKYKKEGKNHSFVRKKLLAILNTINLLPLYCNFYILKTMKQIINNHVHGSLLVTITNNSHSVDTKKMSGYGFCSSKIQNNGRNHLFIRNLFFGYN